METKLDRCEVTELLKTQCAHCLGHKTPEEEQEIIDRAIENLHLRWSHGD